MLADLNLVALRCCQPCHANAASEYASRSSAHLPLELCLLIQLTSTPCTLSMIDRLCLCTRSASACGRPFASSLGKNCGSPRYYQGCGLGWESLGFGDLALISYPDLSYRAYPVLSSPIRPIVGLPGWRHSAEISRPAAQQQLPYC